MRKLLQDPQKFCQPKARPSGHAISLRFGQDNGGAIPSNLLQYPNTESNSLYLRLCNRFGLPPHPARFPEAVPEFFIKFLTDPGEMVVDVFAARTPRASRPSASVQVAGDGPPGAYVITSALRFMDGWDDASIRDYLAAARFRSKRGCEDGEEQAGLPLRAGDAAPARNGKPGILLSLVPSVTRVRRRSTGKLVRVRPQTHRIHFLLALVPDPGVDHVRR